MSPPDERSRPGRSGLRVSTAIKTGPILLDTAEGVTPGAPSAGLVRRRRRWAYELIKRASSPPPTYGSAAWFMLPEGSAERIASVVVAAENWARSGDTLVPDLAAQVENARAAHKQVEAESYVERAEAHRERYGNLGRGDVAALADRRRRRIAEARKPRPGDYLPTPRAGDAS